MMPARSLLTLLLCSGLLASQPRPDLVVVISVDQCSTDLVQRWAKGLSGGLGQLYRGGTTFVNAFHDHGYTETGPGHSVILSGRFPGHTGITENQWLDRGTGKAVYCVADEKTVLVGQPGVAGSSPVHFQGTALGDWLQAQVPGSRAFSLSGKDRAAILMAGRRPQAAYWFVGEAGFTTSTAYAQRLPAWLETFNGRFRERLRHQAWWWTPAEPLEGLTRPGGAITVNGKHLVLGLPRLVQAVGWPLDKAFETRFRRSPFLDEATLEAAEALLEGEDLGRGKGVDLLTLSLSATDAIGHAYGNSGEEMRDQVVRLDRALGHFLQKVRQRSPRAWVILTADHGCTDLPERLAEQGLPARRISLPALKEHLAAGLEAWKPGAGSLVQTVGGSQYYLDESRLRQVGVSRVEAQAALVKVLKAHPDVADAFTLEELLAHAEPRTDPGALSLKGRLALSAVPGRTGDVCIALKPFTILTDFPDLADHGSPWDYDRRVPLLFTGPWKAEVRTEAVSIVDLAPTLARELGLKPAETLDGRPLPLHAAEPVRVEGRK